MTPNPFDVLKHFGLTHNPFGKIQGQHDLYPSLEQRNFRNLVRYAVAHNEMVALVGDWGTGKTTLLASVLATLEEDVVEIAVQADKASLTIRGIEEACLHDGGSQGATPRTIVANIIIDSVGSIGGRIHDEGGRVRWSGFRRWGSRSGVCSRTSRRGVCYIRCRSRGG